MRELDQLNPVKSVSLVKGFKPPTAIDLLPPISSAALFNGVKKILKKYPIINAYLFGSQATGKTTKFSDYDVGIELTPGLKPENIFNLKIKLSADLAKLLKTKVDIVVMNDKKTPTLLNFNIIKDGRLIYSQAKNKRVALEVSIMREWRDWQYYENLWSDIYNKKIAENKI
ncbi:MAG: nucleotidyltransferase domain-containing protein [Parcubacteria group bacterium]|nr:nucleotidyltransferase domain-containing protein [Parcubacteria group bacterium]